MLSRHLTEKKFVQLSSFFMVSISFSGFAETLPIIFDNGFEKFIIINFLFHFSAAFFIKEQ